MPKRLGLAAADAVERIQEPSFMRCRVGQQVAVGLVDLCDAGFPFCGRSRPLSSSLADAHAMLLGVEVRRPCACGCGLPASRTFRWGHNRRRQGSEQSRTLQARTRDIQLLTEEKLCAGCGETMRRSDFPRLSDAKWRRRRCCSRGCSNRAWQEANLAWPLEVQRVPRRGACGPARPRL